MWQIAAIPGDGIGVEVTPVALEVLRQSAQLAGTTVAVEQWPHGAEHYLRTGVTISSEEISRLGQYDAIFLGALGDPRVPSNEHARDILLGLRFTLDLFINLRPVRLYLAAHSPLRDVRPEDVDLVIFRENTEGVYVGMGGRFKAGTRAELAIQEDVSTWAGVERIIRAAFEYARGQGRRRVTLTDKANAMPHAGALWRRVFAEVGAEYAGLERNALYADALALDLVLHPASYDVIVAPNLFGDILSDLAAALVGGLGLAPSASLHPGRPGLFEPVHGSAPDLVGTGRANPLAAILTVALMLEQLGAPAQARAVELAVRRALERGATTPDLGGTLTCMQVGEQVCSELADCLAVASDPGASTVGREVK